jgi:DNA-directed RNA polymerase specialized sigma24 family protein
MSDLDRLTDYALCVRGMTDGRAVAILYDRHRKVLAFRLRVKYPRLEDPEAVIWEAVLETVESVKRATCEAFETVQAIETIRNVRGYIYRVACNLAHDLCSERRQAPLVPAPPASAGDQLDYLASLAGDAGGTWKDLSEGVIRKDLVRALTEAIEALPPERRAIVILTLSGLTPAQIAERKLPQESAERKKKYATAVSVRLHRAKKQLRRILEEKGYGDEPG